MDPITRQLFRAYMARVAQSNGVQNATEQFTVTPAVEQRMEAALQQSSSFLRMINVLPVRQMKGEAIYTGVTGTIAGRTDTSGSGTRSPRDMTGLSKSVYEVAQTDYDTAMPYARLDAWSALPNFQTLIAQAIIEQCALDRIMIGFNGTSRAATTDRVTNPLLQDVHKGWIQKYVEDSPSRVMTGGAVPGTVKIGGTTPDYENLDALVYQASRAFLHDRFIEDPSVKVLVGRNVLDEKYFPIYNKDHEPTELMALDALVSSKRVGGYGAVLVPFMPEGTIMITAPKNLSIYYQLGSRRRYLKDEPEKNRYADYQSVNEDWVVEQYAAGCVIKNLQFGDSSSGGGGD
jgi:P2 family phage major capsid protein